MAGVTCSCGASGFHTCTAGERHRGTIKDRADAQAREKAAVMPNPVTAARRGITVGRYLGLSAREAAMMVMVACSAAITSARHDGAQDVTWLMAIHAEAGRVYARIPAPQTPDDASPA